MIEKIPIKFHVDNNKLIFDEMWIILTGDWIEIEYFMDETGIVHYTNVWLYRRHT